jgi:hypothetical protein
MTTRSHGETVVFRAPFLLKGVDRMLPAGSYRVVSDEELIESLSFPVYRRISTVIFVHINRHLRARRFISWLGGNGQHRARRPARGARSRRTRHRPARRAEP